MKLAIAIYLAAGVILLLVGLYGTGDCSIKNSSIASNAVFIAVWPVYFTADVLLGPFSASGWLHLQTCQGGIPFFR